MECLIKLYKSQKDLIKHLRVKILYRIISYKNIKDNIKLFGEVIPNGE